MTTVTYNIPNISCGHCVHTIVTELGDHEGIISVKASQETRTATISFAEPANVSSIKKLLVEINYPAID